MEFIEPCSGDRTFSCFSRWWPPAALEVNTCCAGEAAPPPESLRDLTLVNRLTWGASAMSVAELRAIGEHRWLDRQLHPRPEDQLPPAVAAQIDALLIGRKPLIELVRELDAQSKAANQR